VGSRRQRNRCLCRRCRSRRRQHERSAGRSRERRRRQRKNRRLSMPRAIVDWKPRSTPKVATADEWRFALRHGRPLWHGKMTLSCALARPARPVSVAAFRLRYRRPALAGSDIQDTYISDCRRNTRKNPRIVVAGINNDLQLAVSRMSPAMSRAFSCSTRTT